MLPGSVDQLPLLPLNHFSPHLRQARTQQLERWTPYSCKFILFIIRAQWLILAWQDVQNNVSYTAALKEKYCLNWECFLAVTTPSALEPASPSCEEAPGLTMQFFFLFLCLPLQANIWRCTKVAACRWIQTPEELQPVSCWSHAYVP